MKVMQSTILVIGAGLLSLCLPACERMHALDKDHEHAEQHKIIVTAPEVKDVVITQQYVCQIHSQVFINVCALQSGYIEEVLVGEGQPVKAGQVMFTIRPTLYEARMKAEKAEADFAELEYKFTRQLASGERPVVSQNEVALYEAKMAKAKAKADVAKAEYDFTFVTARYDGIIDRLYQQKGSLVKEGEVLTSLSDNSVMWVYFNVPEVRYLAYKHEQLEVGDSQHLTIPDSHIELILADGSKFKYDAGDTVTVEGKFNNETGNIPFRADFPNPDGLLRHGQTGTVLIHRPLKHAVVIPQRASFEILDKRYVWVVSEDHVVHQRLITVKHEKDDIFVIEKGLTTNDKIVLEGVRQVHDGDKVEYEFLKPEEVLKHQKYHAE